MVKLKTKTYSGYVDASFEDKIVVMISTADVFQDVAAETQKLSEVIETDTIGNENSYHVTRPLMISMIAPGMYAIHFSTKLSDTDALRVVIAEQDAVIEELLAAVLEG